MDGRFIIFFIACLLYIQVSVQVPQNTETATQKAVTHKKNATESVPCVSGKGDKGLCTSRNFCDYGTAAIDVTLYAKHGYKNICQNDEVCCPPAFIIQQTEDKPENKSDDFSSDADII